MMFPETPVLEIRNLKTSFFTPEGEVQAVRGVSLSLGAGETLGIMGESGSGKTVTALSVLRLLSGTGKITGGEILFRGRDSVSPVDLAAASAKTLRDIRGKKISMVFQDPALSLNPLMPVGKQIGETIAAHRESSKGAGGLFRRGPSGKEIDKQVRALLSGVRIPAGGKRRCFYPHELSGGMRQRAMIAMALACRPDVLIADEPTTALDLTIQSQIIQLLKSIQAELGMAIIFITHDPGLIAELCSRVAVMYGGVIMEEAAVDELFDNPSHPYTAGLLNSMPGAATDGARKLNPISGAHPDMLRPPGGCPFSPRCASACGECLAALPPLHAVGGAENAHFSRCRLLM